MSHTTGQSALYFQEERGTIRNAFWTPEKGDAAKAALKAQETAGWRVVHFNASLAVATLFLPDPNKAPGTRVARFQDLPLGTRFRYLSGGPIWVVLQRHDCGLIAKWEGAEGPLAGQSLCSFAETAAECQTLQVEVVE